MLRRILQTAIVALAATVPTSVPTPVSAATEPPPDDSGRYPLTGLPIDPDGPAQPRPALAVIFDNYYEFALPQYGLNEADVVLEVIVEAQTTRPTGIFNSRDAEHVGPIRSARSTDYDLLGGLNNPILVTSGMNLNVADELATSGFTILDQDDGLFRDTADGRFAPSNLFGDTAELFARGEHAGDAAALFEYDAATPVGTEVSTVELVIGAQLITWEWDPTAAMFLRSRSIGDGPHETASGRVSTENVVVINTTYQPSSADARSPQAITVGRGEAVVYRDGMGVDGTWERVDRTSPFVLLDSSGIPIALDPGRTWVEFVDQTTVGAPPATES